jgi:polysaccharide export outer membrane protein
MHHHAQNRTVHSIASGIACAVGVAALAGCAALPAAGPSTRAVTRAENETAANADIKIIELTDAVTRQVVSSTHTAWFADAIGDGYPIGSVVGKGDVLDIAIWEAPPAALFGSAGGDARLASASLTARSTALPEQMVDSDGRISIPFAGSIQAAGRTPQQIAQDITQRLAGKAHQPQTIVRLVRNATSNVTVVGDVANSGRIPLTARGEKVLDVLASVGGVRQPVGKMTIQITRGDRIASMPMETIIRNPNQNIRLQPDDVVTALFQPYSFIALGATGRNEELPFEGTGITLAQALGRVAGVQDQRADIKGVFIFRMEDPAALDPALRSTAKTTADGKVPVIYRVNMKEASTFFIAQSFPIRNHDVLYVSNAPLADIQKFVNVISSTILPVATAAAIIP